MSLSVQVLVPAQPQSPLDLPHFKRAVGDLTPTIGVHFGSEPLDILGQVPRRCSAKASFQKSLFRIPPSHKVRNMTQLFDYVFVGPHGRVEVGAAVMYDVQTTRYADTALQAELNRVLWTFCGCKHEIVFQSRLGVQPWKHFMAKASPDPTDPCLHALITGHRHKLPQLGSKFCDGHTFQPLAIQKRMVLHWQITSPARDNHRRHCVHEHLATHMCHHRGFLPECFFVIQVIICPHVGQSNGRKVQLAQKSLGYR